MLRTYEGNEATPLSSVFGDDVRMWHAVSFEFDTPYFFIIHARKSGRVWVKETCMLWGQSNVLDFCNLVNADPARKIIQFSILCPSEGEYWQMEELKEIWGYPNSEKFRPLIFFGLKGRLLSRENQRRSPPRLPGADRIYVQQSDASS